MNFRNISIKLRLIVGFLIISLLLVFAGYLATNSIGEINKQSEIMYTDNLQVINNLHNIRYKLVDSTIKVEELIKTKDSVKISDLEDKLHHNNEEADAFFKIIETKLVTGQEIELWKLFKSEVLNSEKNIDKLITAINEDDEDTKKEVLKDLDLELAVMHEHLDKMIAENSTKARLKTADSDKIYGTTVMQMNRIMIIGFILAMIIGLFISRGISKEINRGLEFSEALGEGDLTYDIQKYHSKNEIGKLMDALGEAQVKLRTLITSVLDESNEVYKSSYNLANISDTAKNANSNIIHDFESITEEVYNMDKIVDKISDLIISMGESVISLTNDIEELKKVHNKEGLETINKNLEKLKEVEEYIKNLDSIRNEIIDNFSESISISKEIVNHLNVSSASMDSIRDSIVMQMNSVEQLNSKINEFKL